MGQRHLSVEPLTQSAFAPFGDVIDMDDVGYLINGDTVRRWDHVAKLDIDDAGGRPLLSLMRADPCPVPLRLRIMERHPLSSQAFIPLTPRPFLVVVAPAGDTINSETIRVFCTEPGQGVNYARGIWHHPLLALDVVSDFAVIGRDSDDDNCDFFTIVDHLTIDNIHHSP